MTTVADVVDAVAGVDTHADTLAVAIAAPVGGDRGGGGVPGHRGRDRRLIGFALAHAPGRGLLFAVEGTRCYGIGLSRAVTRLGCR